MRNASVPRVGVLGAGTLGHAIAHHFAAYGADVTLYDPQAEALDAARAKMADTAAVLRELDVWTVDQSDQSEPGVFTVDLQEALDGRDLVIEAAPEVLDLKRDLFGRIEAMVSGSCILASNSSTFPVDELGVQLVDPSRLLNVHFFNPAQLVPLVEVCGSPATSNATLESAVTLLRDIGKQPVVIRRAVPGFVANRLQAALLREALSLVEEDVATPADIDRVITAGIGRRLSHVGIFQTVDLGGLDVFLALARSLSLALSNDVAEPAALVSRVGADELGVKTGRGFYDYPAGAGDVIRNSLMASLAWRAMLPEVPTAGASAGTSSPVRDD